MQKPAQPDALAAARRADPIHAVVPVARSEQRQAMRADGEAPVQRPDTVLEEGRGPRRRPGRRKDLVLVYVERRAFQKGQQFVEHGEIPGDGEIVAHDERQPDAVVGHPGFHALPRSGKPPMLYVARREMHSAMTSWS